MSGVRTYVARKPQEVEAIQWTGKNIQGVVEFIRRRSPVKWAVIDEFDGDDCLLVSRPNETSMTIPRHHYIVPTASGFEILSPNEMADKYEATSRPRVIAVDFDGTLCEDKYPDIGRVNNELLSYLFDQQREGSKLILWTCRVGEGLVYAINWCRSYGLEFDAVNENLPEIIDEYGNDCRKIFADEYIDDRANTIFKLPFKSEAE